MVVRRVQQALIGLLLLTGGVLVWSGVFTGTTNTATSRAVAQQAPDAKYFVVHATRALASGSVIRKDDVALQPSAEAPPRGAVTRVEDAVERVAVKAIATSDILSDANSTAAVKGVNLSELVPPGMRAVALHVSEDSAIANLVRPGDKVDVLVVSNANRTVQAAGKVFPPAEAVTVLQNISVLAVGELTVAGGTAGANSKNVTLVVSPRDAAVIALVRTVGTEYLSLRAAGDDAKETVAAVSSDTFLPKDAPPPAEPKRIPAAAPRETVEVISGPSHAVAATKSDGGK